MNYIGNNLKALGANTQSYLNAQSGPLYEEKLKAVLFGLGIMTPAIKAAPTINKLYRGYRLTNFPPLEKMTQEQIKNYRNFAKDYYRDYIQGTKVNRNDIGEINFSAKGGREVTSHSLHNARMFPKLKEQIKDGRYVRPSNDHKRTDDIEHFHNIENTAKLDGQNKIFEYQIGKGEIGNKFYFMKENCPVDGNRNHNASPQQDNFIIPNTNNNFNPLIDSIIKGLLK